MSSEEMNDVLRRAEAFDEATRDTKDGRTYFPIAALVEAYAWQAYQEAVAQGDSPEHIEELRANAVLQSSRNAQALKLAPTIRNAKLD